jgi:hypothetical protein
MENTNFFDPIVAVNFTISSEDIESELLPALEAMVSVVQGAVDKFKSQYHTAKEKTGLSQEFFTYKAFVVLQAELDACSKLLDDTIQYLYPEEEEI